MNIRSATLTDGTAIARLVQELAWQEREVSPVNRDYLALYLANAGSSVLLAEVNGQIIGLLSYSVRPDLYHAGPVALIEILVVDANCRGQGVGSVLLKDMLGKIQEQNCVEVSVATSMANIKAQRFYQRHGFIEEVMLLEQHF